MPALSIVIPAFNEEAAIGTVVDALKVLGLDAEIIVVDDGSTDRTAEIAAAHGARVIRHPMNCGYGRSLKDAVRAATSDVILATDADGTYPIDRIPDLLAKFSEGFDMVVGARQGPAYRGTFLKMPARYVFKLLVEFTTGRRIPDINSGMRVFRKSVAQTYFADICDGFSFTTTITLVYLLSGYTVAYVPIDYFKRIGRSKVRMLRDTLRTLQYITETIAVYNPLKLFVLIAAFLTLLSLVSLGLLALSGGIAWFVSAVVFFASAWIVFAIGVQTYAIGKDRRPRKP